MRTLLPLFLLFLLSPFSFSSSCNGIDHCITCHRGNTYIFWVCDQCDPQYGIDTKYDSSDVCIYCDSVIPHCLECSNKVDAWSCGRCVQGYQLVVVPLQNDLCVKESWTTEGIEAFLN